MKAEQARSTTTEDDETHRIQRESLMHNNLKSKHLNRLGRASFVLGHKSRNPSAMIQKERTSSSSMSSHPSNNNLSVVSPNEALI